MSIISLVLFTSHPLRVRGLKPYKFAIIDYFEKSHPLRVRGLKLLTHA